LIYLLAIFLGHFYLFYLEMVVSIMFFNRYLNLTLDISQNRLKNLYRYWQILYSVSAMIHVIRLKQPYLSIEYPAI